MFCYSNHIYSDDLTTVIRKEFYFFAEHCIFETIKYYKEIRNIHSEKIDLLKYDLVQENKTNFVFGEITNEFLEKFFSFLNSTKKYNCIGFFEVYGTKHFLKFNSSKTYNHFLTDIFDFRYVIPRIDTCVNLDIKDNNNYTLILEENFIQNHD